MAWRQANGKVHVHERAVNYRNHATNHEQAAQLAVSNQEEKNIYVSLVR